MEFRQNYEGGGYWGAAAISAMYEYDAFGEIADLYLFKSVPSSASAFTGETWNSSYNSGHADAEHTSTTTPGGLW